MIDTSILQGKTAAYYTLGCKLNFAETSAVALELERYGVHRAEVGEQADLCIVNTCTVTEVADHKGRQIIHRMVREHPHALVVVTGCYAQLKPEVLARIGGVGLVVGAEQKQQLVPLIMQRLSGQADVAANTSDSTSASDFFPSCARGDRTRWWLKVQDGCNYFCTYCTIPMARGRSRNASIAQLVEQARGVALQDPESDKEIVLTGVNIGDFGRSTGEHFLDLLQALDGVDGIQRYRISSLEPDLLHDDIIDFVAHSRAFMPHFHIPLQSGSDEVLKLMHRRYDTHLFREKILRIKALMPDAFIGVDVMVGTRGERPELFEETYRFLEDLPISQLHVFPYSERPNTQALRIPYAVDPQEKHLRAQRLIGLSAQKHRAFCQQFVGSARPVLFEHSVRGTAMHGFTDNYVRVEIRHCVSLDGRIRTVHLGALTARGDSLQASL